MASKRLLLLIVVSVGLLLVAFVDGWRPQASRLPMPAEPPSSAITVSKVSVTPDPITPSNVLTIGVQLANAAGRVDGVIVQVEVLGESGEPALEMRQGNAVLSAKSTQAVYWIWRIPDRLTDGSYFLTVTVRGEDGKKMLAHAERVTEFKVRRTL